MLEGELVSAGLIPVWLPFLILVPLVVLCIALVVPFLRPPAVRSLTVDPPNPVAGQAVTIRWQVTNAQRVELRPLVSNLDPAAGEYTFPSGFPASQVLTFVAWGRMGQVSQPIQIAVATPTPGEPVVWAKPTPTTSPTVEPTAEPTPTATPEPSRTPTSCPAPDAKFAAAFSTWPQIGCPIAPAISSNLAVQHFENGLMFWRQDKKVIYVLLSSGSSQTWQQFPDTFVDGMPEEDPAIVPPAGKQQPRRGFGKVWREQLGGASAAIGWALEHEQGYTGNVQAFSAGTMLTSADGKVFILFADSRWASK
jgi:hypothetical protein